MRRQYEKPQGGGGIPDGYTQLQYIQSSGSQHILTDVYGGQKAYVYGDITPISANSGVWCGIMSPSNNYVKSYSGFDRQWIALSYGDGYDTGYTPRGITTQLTNYTRYVIEFQTLTGNHWLKVNGSTVWSGSTASSYVTTLKYAIFGRNSDGTVNAKVSIRVHEIYIYIDDVLKGHYLPVKRDSDNKPGLYDLVSGTFYTNAGTGAFSYA